MIRRILFALFVSSIPLAAHGAMESPMSRVYGCYLTNNAGAACRAAVDLGGQQAVYDWNGVNIGDVNGAHRERIPDGQLCAAGREQHKGFNLARTDWSATNVTEGPRDFVFHGTAPHATRYFRFFITREGYNPLSPLTWASLEDAPFCEPTWTLDNFRYRMRCTLPRRTGQHLIYMIWQRSDSPEAFYSCSDVNFGGGTTPPPPPPSPWREIGQIRAAEDLPVGTTVTLRIFDATGRDAGSPSVVLEPGQTARTEWPYVLAREVNAKTTLVAAGVLGADGLVTPTRSATANAVYTRLDGYRTEVDIRVPVTPPPPPPPPSGSFEFAYPDGIGRYKDGTVVLGSQGGLYQCRPSPYTAWCNVGSPSGLLAYAPGVGHAWREAWIYLGPAPAPAPPPGANVLVYPDGRASYTAGTVVRGTNGRLYRCRPFPNAGWCADPSRLHYEPGVGSAWQDAWTLIE